METVRISVNEKKTGAEKQADIFLPTTIDEAVSLVGEKKFMSWARSVLLARAKRHLASGAKPRRKLLKIALNDLTANQKAFLAREGLIRSE